MSKKRAFVRYTKSGEIVPGSLIITTNGGYPDKSSLWKEVTTNECCDGGGSTCSEIIMVLTLQRFSQPNCEGFIDENFYFIFACNDQFKISTALDGSIPVPDGYYNSPLGSNFGFNVYVENSIAVENIVACPA